ncbi:MAG: 7-cyano-7-deazaguanine synthase QueC [bacterium]
MDKAIVIFSGGQDSSSCLFYAINNYDEVIALTFNYKQRHEKEVRIAKNIIKKIRENFNYNTKITHKILDIDVFKNLNSSLINHDLNIEDAEEREKDYPNTFVPGRNMIFLNIGAIVAYNHNIKDIYTGVNQADYSGYPDCRLEFIQSMEETLELAFDYSFNIKTPLINLTKDEIWEFVYKIGEKEFKLVKEKSLTCYNGIVGRGCGECPACKLRNKGLKKFIKRK